MSKLKDQYIEECIRFFDGEMPEEEKQAFLKKVKQNKELNKTFRIQFAIERFLADSNKLLFLQSMVEAEKKNNRFKKFKKLLIWK